MENDKVLGLNQNIAGALSYFLGAITGVIFFLLSGENKYVKFHASQSIIVFIALYIIAVVSRWIPLVGGLLSIIVSIANLLLWVGLMYKAYNGEKFRLPIVGDLAENLAGS
ncbi:MAG: DUF4870 domain-containing protein [Clostridia bacterium]